MKVCLIAQARISSSRLPGKVLLPLGEKTVLDLLLKRVSRAKTVDAFCVATAAETDSEKLVEIAKRHKWSVYQGSLTNVLDRFYQAALEMDAGIVVRITGDCPLLDPRFIDEAVERFKADGVDYLSNVLKVGLPEGQSVEVFSFKALERAWSEASLDSEKEHVTPYIWKNSNAKGGSKFSATVLTYQPDRSQFRMTLDHPEDYTVLKELVRLNGEDATYEQYVSTLEKNPEISKLNSEFKRLEGYRKSLDKERG